LGGSGRLEVSHAPGGSDFFVDEGCAYFEARNVAIDLKEARAQGVDVVVSLLESVTPEYQRACESAGIRLHHQPIEDFGVPDFASTRDTVSKIKAALDAGETVLVHCRSGQGRSGTILSCLVTTLGMTPAQAINYVRAYRKHAVETKEQVGFVVDFARLQRWR
jgi:protein-tyrosine phosphatase